MGFHVFPLNFQRNSTPNLPHNLHGEFLTVTVLDVQRYIQGWVRETLPPPLSPDGVGGVDPGGDRARLGPDLRPVCGRAPGTRKLHLIKYEI